MKWYMLKIYLNAGMHLNIILQLEKNFKLISEF
jgi:hypothetical protein